MPTANQTILKLICAASAAAILVAVAVFPFTAAGADRSWEPDMSAVEKFETDETKDDGGLTSQIPIIEINLYETAGVSKPDTTKRKTTMRIIDNGYGMKNRLSDEGVTYDCYVNLRGQTSAANPKYPMRIDFIDKSGSPLKIPFLGMAKDDSWVFHAPYTDKSLLRNYLAYNLSRSMFFAWAPDTRFVEVVVRGNPKLGGFPADFKGLYVVVESIKTSRDRVPIEDFTIAASDNLQAGGGYIVARDKTKPGDNIFTLISGQWVVISTPSVNQLTSSGYEYIKDDLRRIEEIIMGPDFMDPVNGYRAHFDAEQFIEDILIHEFLKNVDGLPHFASVYMYRDVGGKLVMGPPWDFDFGTGNADYYGGYEATGWYAMRTSWAQRLLEDKSFAEQLVARWYELRASIFSDEYISEIIDAALSEIGEDAVKRHEKRWKELYDGRSYIWPNGNHYVESNSEEIMYVKSFLVERGAWIDKMMPTLLLKYKNSVDYAEYIARSK